MELLEGLEVSEILKSNLEFSGRIDSEYYRKNLLSYEYQITSKKFIKLENSAIFLIGPFGSSFNTENYVDNGEYRYVRGQDVKPFILKDGDNKYIPIEDYSRLIKYALQEKDILISVVGTLGNACIVQKKDLPAIFSCKSTVLRTTKINPVFALTYLNCKYGSELLKRKERGAIQKGLNLEDLKTILIPEYSNAFQNQIELIFYKAQNFLTESKIQYQQAENLLLFELGLASLDKSTLDRLEKEIRLKKPDELIEELQDSTNQLRALFDAAIDETINMLDENPNLIAELREEGRDDLAEKIEKGIRTKIALTEYQIEQIKTDRYYYSKHYQNQINLIELYEAEQQNTNIKSFSESFGSTGRLDAEYYQKKYEKVIQCIEQNNYDKLGNIVKINKSIEPGSVHYSDDGLPFVRVSDYNKFGLSTPDKYLKDQFCKDNAEQIKKLKPKKETILFSKDGSVGTAFMLRNDADFITSGAILHLKVKNKEKVIPQYLTLVLNSKLVQMQAERDAGGSIILHWRVGEIENVIVPIIDFSKQQEIADLVEESFRLRSQSEHLLAVAKRAVEIAIEEGEEVGLEYIAENAGYE